MLKSSSFDLKINYKGFCSNTKAFIYKQVKIKTLQIKFYIIVWNSKVNGFVAQLVEQLTLNQLVVGSSPTGPKLKEDGFIPILF